MNPSDPSYRPRPMLMDLSKGNPANVDMSIFEPKRGPLGQGIVNPGSLQQCKIDNPEPEPQSEHGSVVLTGCKFTTPSEDLEAEKDFQAQCNVKWTGDTSPQSLRVSFDLKMTWDNEGTPEEEEGLQTFTGYMDQTKSDQVVTLKAELPWPPSFPPAGTKVQYKLVATHPAASDPSESEMVEILLMETMHHVEIPDLHFAPRGHYPCLDEDGELVGALSKALQWSKENPRQQLVAFGHSDLTGNHAVNFDLSDRRAQATVSLIAANGEVWESLAHQAKVEEMQRCLKALTSKHGWACDPGEVDGQDGPVTKDAVKAFQAASNSRYKLGLAEDGVAGPKTWKAMHRVICGLVAQAMGVDDPTNQMYPKWTIPDISYSEGKGAFGCGESFPVKDVGVDGLISEENRRVDLLFNPGWAFQYPVEDRTQVLPKKDCLAYNQGATRWIQIEPKPLSRDARKPQKTVPVITTLHLGVFNDGTGNSLEHDIKTDSVSNVGKLYQLFPQTTEGSELRDKHYVQGIGTDGEGFDKLKQGVASGFDARVNDSLRWLQKMSEQHPDAELKLYIFGFSRGAAESRVLVNELFNDETLRKYKLDKAKIEVVLLAIFDTVVSIAVPGQGYNFGFDVRVYASRVTKVVHLCAQSEVRATFDLWSIRIPSGLGNATGPEEYLKSGPVAVGAEDWEEIRGRNPLPNPEWEEWILPAMHADVGGGYGPEEWIPDLPIPEPRAGESVNEYVYRVMDERAEHGWTPRGLLGNDVETKEQVEARVKQVHEERYRRELAEFERVREEARATGQAGAIPAHLQSMPVLKIPGVRLLNNDLSRLALMVMMERAEKAGVKWKRVDQLLPENRPWFEPLPPGHIVSQYIQRAKDLNVLESMLQTGVESFRRLISDYSHDSRYFLDLSRRKRDVYFGGRIG